MVAGAWLEGFEHIFVPESNVAEAVLIPDLEVIPVPSLAGDTWLTYAHLFQDGRPSLPFHQCGQWYEVTLPV